MGDFIEVLGGRLAVKQGTGATNHFAGFVGENDIDWIRSAARDEAMRLVAETVGVLGVVDFEVEVAEAGDDVAADGGVALADGGGENEGVGAVQAGSHLTDGALDAVDEEVVGEFGLGVAVVTEADDLAEIIGGAGDAEEAAFFVEVGFKVVALELELAADGEGGGGVNVAAAGGHH